MTGEGGTRRAPVRIMGAQWTQNGLGMKSRLPIIWPRQAWGKRGSGVEGRFSFPIRLNWWFGLLSTAIGNPWRQGRIYFLQCRSCTTTIRRDRYTLRNSDR
jgi:hypothetical protein